MPVFRKRLGGVYEGPVAFVDGFHYPVDKRGRVITKQPLVVDMESGTEVFRWGNAKSPKHNHVYERNVLEVRPFDE